MKIQSAEEFVRLCETEDPSEYRLAATGEADESVWWEVLERFPERKEAVIFNKNVPLAVLAALSADEAPRLRAFVAGKRKLSRELFLRLARDTSPSVRSSLIGNPKIPTDVLETLLRDPEDWVKAKAAEVLAHRKAAEA